MLCVAPSYRSARCDMPVIPGTLEGPFCGAGSGSPVVIIYLPSAEARVIGVVSIGHDRIQHQLLEVAPLAPGLDVSGHFGSDHSMSASFGVRPFGPRTRRAVRPTAVSRA